MSKQQLLPSADRVAATTWLSGVSPYPVATYADLLGVGASQWAGISRTALNESFDGDWQIQFTDPTAISGQVPLSIRMFCDVYGYAGANPLNETEIKLNLYTFINSVGILVQSPLIGKGEMPRANWLPYESVSLDVAGLTWTNINDAFMQMWGMVGVATAGQYVAVFIRNLRLELLSGKLTTQAITESADTVGLTLTHLYAKNAFTIYAISESADTVTVTITKQATTAAIIEPADTLTVTITRSYTQTVTVAIAESDDTLSVTVGRNTITVAIGEAADTVTVTTTNLGNIVAGDVELSGVLYSLTMAISETADTLVLVVDRQWMATTPTVTYAKGQVIVTAVLSANLSVGITAKQCQIAYDSAFATILVDSGLSVATGTGGETITWYVPWTRLDDDYYFVRVGFRALEFPDVTAWSPNVGTFSTAPMTITASATQGGENIIISASVITSLHAPPWRKDADQIRYNSS